MKCIYLDTKLHYYFELTELGLIFQQSEHGKGSNPTANSITRFLI